MASFFELGAYLRRIGMPPPMPEDLLSKNRLTLLRSVMRAHSTAVPFENLDLVLRRCEGLLPTDCGLTTRSGTLTSH